MREIFQLVGETAAHSIWAVADGENLDPILTTMDESGKSQFLRLAMDDCDDAVRYGHDKLEHQDAGKIGAVFVADGFVTLDTGKTDALVVEVRVYNGATAKCQMVIPYRPANSSKGFAVHRPQITELENIEQAKFQPLMQAFFEGLERHQQGGQIWNQYYVDEADAEDAISDVNDLTSLEWSTLHNAPFSLFFLLASSAGADAKGRLAAFTKALAGSSKYQCDLLHRIATNSLSQASGLIEKLEGEDIDHIEELGRICEIIDRKLPRAGAKEFKIALIALAKDMADASNDLLGAGSSMSDQEKFALARIILCLQVDLDS